MLGAVSPLLAIPAISYSYGADGWAAIAIGQSVGGAFAVFVELGWALTGPQEVASSLPARRSALYRAALRTKSLILLPSVPLAYVVAAAITQDFSLESGVAAAATAVVGLTPVWFFLGTGQVGRILMLDSLPRLIVTAASSIALLYGAPLLVSPLSILALSVAIPFLGLIGLPRAVPTASEEDLNLRQLLRRQIAAVAARGMSALYISLPVALVGLVAPASVAPFAAAERLQRMALALLQAAPNSLQAYVGSARTGRDRISRVKTVLLANSLMGLLAGAVFAVSAPTIAEWVFANTLEIQYTLSIPCGCVIFLTATSRAAGGLGLVAFSRIGAIALSAGVGGVLGVAAIPLLARQIGAVGAMWGEVLAEAAVLAIQLTILIGAMRLCQSTFDKQGTGDGVEGLLRDAK
jgi:hypothetical protein